VKRICAIVALVTASLAVPLLVPLAEIAVAQTVPLPRPRPFSNTESATARSAPGTLSTSPHSETPPAPSACRLRLTAERAIAPSVDDISGPGGCGGSDLVRLEAVVMPDMSRVEISPPAVLQCAMADALVNWVRDDLAELAAFNLGSRLKSMRNYAAYHCRPRNNIIGAMMSEHGRGNAIDVRSITLVNGKTVEPTDVHVAREFREGWKKSVCGRFSTVLGPGSDGYHENHIHVDLMQRRNGYRAMCQWDVRMPSPAVQEPDVTAATAASAAATVPLPTPRPKIDPPAARP
jgi:hypothetical protein